MKSAATPFNEKLGFDGVQFHDDDAVPDMDNMTQQQIVRAAGDLKAVLDNHGLTAEFIALRLWMNPPTIDGGGHFKNQKTVKFQV